MKKCRFLKQKIPRANGIFKNGNSELRNAPRIFVLKYSNMWGNESHLAVGFAFLMNKSMAQI